MPSRAASLGIILFWLGTAGWFARREIVPLLSATQAPPYVIELADEAMRQAAPVNWTVTRNGEPLTTATTRVEFQEVADTFTLTCDVRRFTFALAKGIAIDVEALRNAYRVDRTGGLLGTRTEIRLNVGGSRVGFTASAELRDGQFWPRCRLTTPLGDFDQPLDPVPASAGPVLNPMHPVERVHGLAVGRRWTTPLFDPLADAVRIAVPKLALTLTGIAIPQLPGGPRLLIAEVTGPRPLEWDGGEHPCLVIEYRADEYMAATWVRARDGLVLRQQAAGFGEELAFQRSSRP